MAIPAFALIAVLVPLSLLLWKIGTDPGMEQTFSDLPDSLTSFSTLLVDMRALNREVVPALSEALSASRELVRELRGPADFMVSAAGISVVGFSPLDQWLDTSKQFRDQTRPRAEEALDRAVVMVEKFRKGPAVEMEQKMARIARFLNNANQTGTVLHNQRMVLIRFLITSIILLGILLLLNVIVVLCIVNVISSMHRQIEKKESES